jgi:hypothetical protein
VSYLSRPTRKSGARMRRISLAVVLTAVSGLALLAASGAFASALVGSPLTGNFSTGSRSCSPACTDFNTVLTEPGANVTSPIDGVIVRWRMTGNGAGASFALRVVHPAGGGEYIGAGTSSPEVPTGDGPSVFETSLPINEGDMIGVNVPTGVTWSGNAASSPGSSFVSVQPTLAETLPAQTPNFTVNDTEEGVNADVEIDCDNDGLGDETQDADLPAACKPPSDVQPVSPVATVKKCKKHKKKHSASSAKKKHCKKKKRKSVH